MDPCRQNYGRTLRSARLQFECSIISMVQYRHKIRFGFRRTPWRFVTCSNATGSMKVAIFSGRCRRVALVTSVAIDCVRYNGLQLNFWSYQLDASVERLAHLDHRYTHGPIGSHWSIFSMWSFCSVQFSRTVIQAGLQDLGLFFSNSNLLCILDVHGFSCHEQTRKQTKHSCSPSKAAATCYCTHR